MFLAENSLSKQTADYIGNLIELGRETA